MRSVWILVCCALLLVCCNSVFGQRRDSIRCALQAERGPCREFNRRYFYNTKTRKCENFIYGGCKGNDNNFLTERSCESECEVKSRIG